MQHRYPPQCPQRTKGGHDLQFKALKGAVRLFFNLADIHEEKKAISSYLPSAKSALEEERRSPQTQTAGKRSCLLPRNSFALSRWLFIILKGALFYVWSSRSQMMQCFRLQYVLALPPAFSVQRSGCTPSFEGYFLNSKIIFQMENNCCFLLLLFSV